MFIIPMPPKKDDNDIDKHDSRHSKEHYRILILLIICWYCTAVIAVISSREVMLVAKWPFFLSSCQFLIACVSTRTLSSVILKPSKVVLSNLHPIAWLISLSYTTGFIFTNVAISKADPSFVETIKASEPFSSVLLGYFFLSEGPSILTMMTLVPICGGVALASLQHTGFDSFGFLAAAASNIGFSGRAVLTKYLNSQFPSPVDEIHLFGLVSRLGLLLLLPMACVWEASDVHQAVAAGSINIPMLLLLILINGFAYSTYNLASFMVLARTDLVTHAVLNVFRRVVIITCAAIFFRVNVTVLNCLGVCVAVLGVFAFGYSKSRK